MLNTSVCSRDLDNGRGNRANTVEDSYAPQFQLQQEDESIAFNLEREMKTSNPEDGDDWCDKCFGLKRAEEMMEDHYDAPECRPLSLQGMSSYEVLDQQIF